MLVRTWNVFHGNAHPPERRAFLAETVRLVAADEPAIVCLQELPVWSFRQLGEWSGMTAVADVAARPRVGPLPWSAEAGRIVTELNHGLFRSAFTGQGNALLLARDLRVVAHAVVPLNAADFRRRAARRLRLGLVDRLAWAKERRVCQVTRIARRDTTFVVANLHATAHPDKRIPDAELLRAATFADGFADPGERIVLAGDFNVSVAASRALPELLGPEWGFAGASPRGIDHILVRGFDAGELRPWPVERRRIGGRILSDHAPVERTVS